jgi:DNA polymerase-1
MKKRLAEGKSNWNLYMQRTVDEKYRGYIKNIYGRIWKPDYPSFHYKGFEALVSGTATGDMTKIAMINIQEFLERWKLESRMILPVHDEIIMEIKHGEEKIVVDHIKQIMEHFPEVTEVVPVRVDIERSSKNWWEKEEVYDSKTDAWTVEL